MLGSDLLENQHPVKALGTCCPSPPPKALGASIKPSETKPRCPALPASLVVLWQVLALPRRQTPPVSPSASSPWTLRDTCIAQVGELASGSSETNLPLPGQSRHRPFAHTACLTYGYPLREASWGPEAAKHALLSSPTFSQPEDHAVQLGLAEGGMDEPEGPFSRQKRHLVQQPPHIHCPSGGRGLRDTDMRPHLPDSPRSAPSAPGRSSGRSPAGPGLPRW